MKVKELRQILSGLPGDMETDVVDIHINHEGISLSARTLCIHANKLASVDESEHAEDSPKPVTLRLDNGNKIKLELRMEDNGSVVMDAIGGNFHDPSSSPILKLTEQGELCGLCGVPEELGFHLTKIADTVVYF